MKKIEKVKNGVVDTVNIYKSRLSNHYYKVCNNNDKTRSLDYYSITKMPLSQLKQCVPIDIVLMSITFCKDPGVSSKL